jgi:HEAT repeat protein
MPRNATPEQRLAWHLDHQRHCGCRPIPSRLAALTRSSPISGSLRGQNALRRLLSGGDRRSIAQSKHLLALVRTAPERVAELASLAEDPDWLVSMRAIDLLEKIAHEHADWVKPHKKLFIRGLADSDRWEIRLQIVRALPLLDWTPRERKRVIQILRQNVEHRQKFVRAWALDGLATFAEHDRGLVPIVTGALENFERSGSKALQTRARHIRARLRAALEMRGSAPNRRSRRDSAASASRAHR